MIDPKVVEALVAENARREESPLNELTPRERDVLREMAEGKNNAAIAEALFLPSVGREGDPLDLPQARDQLGDDGSQARQGRHPLSGREQTRAVPRTGASHEARDRPSGHGPIVESSTQRLDTVAQPV